MFHPVTQVNGSLLGESRVFVSYQANRHSECHLTDGEVRDLVVAVETEEDVLRR